MNTKIVLLFLGCMSAACMGQLFNSCTTAPFYYFFEFDCTSANPSGNSTCNDHCRCAHGMASGYCNPNFVPSLGHLNNPPCICSTTQAAPPVMDNSQAATSNPLSCTNQEKAVDALCRTMFSPNGLPYMCSQDCQCAHALTGGACVADPNNPTYQICQCW